MNKKKLRVAVVYGGRSAEHEVSCRSAANVIDCLDKNLFEVIPIGIDHAGNWHLGQEVYNESQLNHIVKKIGSVNGAWFAPEWVGKQAQQVVSDMRSDGTAFDIIFPVLHGVSCEDGTLQGLLELANVPYVGCGVLSSAVGMDKDISKRLAKEAGVLVPDFISFKQLEWQTKPNQYAQLIKEKIKYPLFVKPVNTGSSIGISKVHQEKDLHKAITEAFLFDTRIIVEKALNMVELEVAVLESLPPVLDPIVSMVGQIKPIKDEFYTYQAKYIDEAGAELIFPADISSQAASEARHTAKQIFKILECEGLARVDLFLNKEDNRVYFNEINSLPGFTNISMYPKLMEASGIPVKDLLTHLIQLAMVRHKTRSKLIKSYADELAVT